MYQPQPSARIRLIYLPFCIPLLALILAAIPLSVAAQTLTPECETELALSALPKRLRDQATAYIHTDSGYQRVGQARTTFACIVERNHPLALIPQCLDQAGATTILPALIYKSEQIMAGEPPATVIAAYKTKLQGGEFQAPVRPGVSYMTSAYNRVYLTQRNERIPVGPHVMYYAPGLNNEDIGGSQPDAMQNRGMPFVLDAGPHGYMISFVEKASNSAAVEQACGEQLSAFDISMAPRKNPTTALLGGKISSD